MPTDTTYGVRVGANNRDDAQRLCGQLCAYLADAEHPEHPDRERSVEVVVEPDATSAVEQLVAKVEENTPRADLYCEACGFVRRHQVGPGGDGAPVWLCSACALPNHQPVANPVDLRSVDDAALWRAYVVKRASDGLSSLDYLYADADNVVRAYNRRLAWRRADPPEDF